MAKKIEENGKRFPEELQVVNIEGLDEAIQEEMRQVSDEEAKAMNGGWGYRPVSSCEIAFR
jgi:hypothetical protein